jgi:ribosomal protein S19E (S16A)
MIAELDDYDLTPGQWETLKSLRRTAFDRRALNKVVLQQLVELGLAELVDGSPVLTSTGRKVLVRGSSSLLDVAA